jgi:hypothetical protein
MDTGLIDLFMKCPLGAGSLVNFTIAPGARGVPVDLWLVRLTFGIGNELLSVTDAITQWR